jgi:hypothetical protein
LEECYGAGWEEIRIFEVESKIKNKKHKELVGMARVTNPISEHSLNLSPYVRFEAFTAVTMKNAVFWDIKPQFVLHRRHITSPLQSPAS